MSEPHTQLREQIARIIDPVAYEDFPVGGPEPDHDWWDREQALRKADAILSLLNSSQAKEAGSAEGWKLVPVEPTEEMLKAAFVAMNETPSGTWKRMKEEGVTPRRLFDVKMAPRYRAMIAAAPASAGEEP